jgi:hypothetical protein
MKDCIGIVHGGQGCVMFVRLMFSQHYKESFEIASSSSLHEDGAVFSACGRVEEGVDVLLARYPHVKVIPIITTCSTEVIGDDVDGVIRKLNEGLLKEKYPGREVHLIAVHTPSFVGSMINGYDVAVRDFVKHFATKTEPDGKLNLVTGWVKLDARLLAECCPGARLLTVAQLPGFDIGFFGYTPKWDGAEETLVAREGGTTWGLVLALRKFDAGRMDSMQNVHGDGSGTYFHYPMNVRGLDGQTHSVLLYMKTALGAPRMPSAEYRDRIADGARAHGMPEEYIARLRAFEAPPASYPVPYGMRVTLPVVTAENRYCAF